MSFPRYPEYRDSGMEWLGEVPAHWTVTRFSRVIAAIKDGTHGTFERVAEGRPLLSAKNVLNGHLDVGSTESLISDIDHAEIVANGFPREGDLLLTIVGTIGRACVYEQAEPFAFQRSVCFVRLKQEAFPHFFYYLSQSKFFQEQLTGKSKSSAQAGVYMGDVASMSVILPPSAFEQIAIVTFLDRETAKIDALVAEQEKLIALLQEKRQAVISHAVTKGLDPNVPMKDSGVEWLGEVPAHWEVRPLKHLTEFRSGGTPDKGSLNYWDGEVPWASAKDLKVEDLHDTADHITDWALEAGAASLVPAGSVLVVVRGMILARTFPVVTARVPMAINQDLKALIPRQGVRPDYLATLLRGSQAETLNRLDEAGHGTKALRMDAWGAMRLPVPPLDEQEQIAAHLRQVCDGLDASRAELGRAITLLQERRTALISAAVTGQIDVRLATHS